jgi:hypothetical protein
MQQCSSGQDIIDTLIAFSEDKEIIIDRVDIFGHGYDCGVIGAKSDWEGLFVDKSKPIPDSKEPTGES